MKDYSSMTIQERIEDMFAYLAVCRQMEAMLPERIEILEMGLNALMDKIEKEEPKDMIVAKIENMTSIPWTCDTCPFQTSFGNCPFLKPEHQNCPVTFYQELVGPATYKTADGVTVIDVFKTGRRCLCPLEDKTDEVQGLEN